VQKVHSLLLVGAATMLRMPARHVLLALVVMVVWGVNFVVVDVALDTFPPLLLGALRFTLVALPAVFLIRPPKVHWRWVLAVGVFSSGIQFALLFVAMDVGMPAGLASLVLQLQAMFTILLAVALLGERPRRRQLGGAVLALAGIAIIAGGRGEDVPLAAVLLSCGAALSWAAGNIATRRAQAPDAKALLVWSSLVPPIPLFAMSLALEDRGEIGTALSSFDVGGTLALLYIVVLSTGFGYGAWTWLLTRHPASTVAPFTLAVPVVGIGSAWLMLGEQPNRWELLGAAVVMAGLALTVLGYRRRDERRPSRLGSVRLRWT
jgi:O-acetylserine/cysteine efflux transporter